MLWSLVLFLFDVEFALQAEGHDRRAEPAMRLAAVTSVSG
jgi:hypothetical protein